MQYSPLAAQQRDQGTDVRVLGTAVAGSAHHCFSEVVGQAQGAQLRKRQPDQTEVGERENRLKEHAAVLFVTHALPRSLSVDSVVQIGIEKSSASEEPPVNSYRLAFMLGVSVTCSLARAVPQTPVAPAISGNSRETDSASCFVRLDDGGPTLAVPQQFWRLQCGKPAQPVTQQWFGFDINYPQMTAGTWIGVMDRYLQHDLGEGAPIKQFSARIVWIFFDNEIPSPLNKNWHGPEPQVWRMKENAKDIARRENGFPNPQISASEIPGLMRTKWGEYLPPSPEALQRLKAIGWTPPPPNQGEYTEMPEADYELLAYCDDRYACEGHVQLRQSHIQYRFLIPNRAKDQMAKFIASTNGILQSWIRN